MTKNSWVTHAIQTIEADFNRSADTHLIPIPLPCFPNLQLYVKDESTHPSGSLKHRLARSLFLYGLCNGFIKENTTIVEASSGSTAISEAYFAKLLNIPFVAVVPQGTSQKKIEQIEFYHGRIHLVAGNNIYEQAQRVADELNGHYMDQFTFAERATDWRGNNNIAESIFMQMQKEPYPIPKWIVIGAGTGGTAATIGRYINYKGYDTHLCVADPSHSVFYDYFQTNDPHLTITQASAIEGIGRPRVEPSFVKSVIDRMLKIPDAASFAAIDFFHNLMNRCCGASTGTNLYAALQLMHELHHNGQKGSVVTMICDSGERYLDTYYNDTWLKENNYFQEKHHYLSKLNTLYHSGSFY